MTQDPHRLSDDPADPELARALREAQGDVLSPEAVARVQASLVAAGIPAAGGASGGGLGAGSLSPMAKLLTMGPRAAPNPGFLRKLLAAGGVRVGLVGLGLVGLGLLGFAAMRSSPNPPEAPSAALDPPVATAAAAPVTREETSEPPPASVPTEATAGTSRARASARLPAAAATPSPREGALLLEARRALGTDPARALALLRAHALEFPASQLGPERARIAAEARQRLEK